MRYSVPMPSPAALEVSPKMIVLGRAIDHRISGHMDSLSVLVSLKEESVYRTHNTLFIDCPYSLIPLFQARYALCAAG